MNFLETVSASDPSLILHSAGLIMEYLRCICQAFNSSAGACAEVSWSVASWLQVFLLAARYVFCDVNLLSAYARSSLFAV